jgi:Tfp pilus assembly protein PilX
MTTLPSRPSLRKSERGSVLIIAVIAVLLVSIMLSSLSLLGKLEATIGLNYKSQAQAEATAEAGLDWARDQVRTAGAAGVGTGFTPWFNGAKATHMLTSGGQAVGPFTFNVRIDNDCAAYNTVSTAIQESTTCTNATDTNETAVLTSWATVGAGRSRVRAAIYIDNPWKHVCSNSQNDPGGPFCNSAGNTKGNPSVTPSDPQDPHGPRGYVDLPRPVIGCSRIWPGLHSTAPTTDCPAASTNLYSQPAVTGYPAFPAVPADGGPMLVLMGDDPAITATAKKCNIDPDPATTNIPNYYFGYFDCALSTPCPASLCGAIRKACVRNADSRVTSTSPYYDPTNYASAGTGTPVPGCGGDTGMVWIGSWIPSNITAGSVASPGVFYVMHDKAASMAKNGAGKAVADLGPQDTYFNGTIVSEGDVISKNKAALCVNGPAPSPLPANSCPTPQTGYSATKGYGYPLALMSYDPKLPYPTVSPQAPQPISVNFGSNNTNVNGSVYSGGQLTFNPINVNGTSIAFNIDLQSATSTYNYVPQYGNDAPPAGFLPGTSDPVVMLPKSFITCNNYNDDSGGSTACQ